jgi:hypothetical protein
MFSGAVITPVNLLPAGQNPLLGEEEEEECVCLSGDEEAASLHDKLIAETDQKDCVYCSYGMSRHQLAKQELDEIHSLEEEHYGTMSDRAMFSWIHDEYRTRIETPLKIQQEVKTKKTGQEQEQIPEWSTEAVAKHFEREGLYMHRMIGNDIKFCDLLQTNLRFHGIAKKKNNRRELDGEKIKLWQGLSKTKVDLISRMHILYPHIAKRQKKSSTEGSKPSGAK